MKRKTKYAPHAEKDQILKINFSVLKVKKQTNSSNYKEKRK